MSNNENVKTRKNFHFVLQGKGGVGKTTVATFITQYLKDHLKQDYLAIDTDQVNASFASFKALNVEPISVMNEDNKIVDKGWEDLIDKLINCNKSNIIIDNGASSFVPLTTYMYEYDTIEMLTSEFNNYVGNVFFHIVLAGGEGLSHTLAGLDTICKKFNHEKMQIVVWLNQFLSKIEKDGKRIEDFKEYKDNQEKIFAVVKIPTYKGDLFKKDLSDMLENNKTFTEIVDGAFANIFTRSRCHRMRRELFEILDNINIIFDEEE